jgi:hypothetical protein
MTQRGIPCTYYGTEYLFEGFTNPDDLVRQEFSGGWEGDAINYFEQRNIQDRQKEAFEFYNKLTSFRTTSQLGELKLKQFVFSEEVISTGVDEVDSNIRDYYKRTQFTLKTGGSGNYVEDEIIYQGSDLANANAQAIVHTWTAGTRKLDVIRVQGNFAGNTITIGATSGASWRTNNSTFQSDTAFDNSAFEDINDATRIETESDGIIDFTEINPFGEP